LDADSERFVVPPSPPRAVGLAQAGMLPSRARAALSELARCEACPRGCGVNRLEGERRTCQIGRYARVASAFAHMGEEDCLRGTRGSGTIFFSRCNLHCVFCQNWDISQRTSGEEMSGEGLAALMLDLQARGCHNVNLVTPEHVVPQVVEALSVAAPALRVPVVYNTSAYDSLASLRLLDGLVDVYMPDFKVWSPGLAARLLGARDYPERARDALTEMHRQVGPLVVTRDGVAQGGVLVRHLVMPGLLDESRAIVRWLATELSKDTYVNIMGQYRPAHLVAALDRNGEPRYAEIARRPWPSEIDDVYRAAREAGLWRFHRRAEQ
jgi:putative pyruvate formate lyase activating enzyme